MLVPFAWMVLTALKTNQEAISVNPFYIFPASGWHWENFGTVWKSYNFVILYKNTLLMIFFRVVCACLTATMAGYAFGRLNFPFKNALFALVLIQMMVPAQIFIIPQYLMVSKMGMLNTTFGLVFPGLVTAFGTYLLKTGYEGLPKELEEAASIDGCSVPGRFLHIMMPLTRSFMVSLGIFTHPQPQPLNPQTQGWDSILTLTLTRSAGPLKMKGACLIFCLSRKRTSWVRWCH